GGAAADRLPGAPTGRLAGVGPRPRPITVHRSPIPAAAAGPDRGTAARAAGTNAALTGARHPPPPGKRESHRKREDFFAAKARRERKREKDTEEPAIFIDLAFLFRPDFASFALSALSRQRNLRSIAGF